MGEESAIEKGRGGMFRLMSFRSGGDGEGGFVTNGRAPLIGHVT